MTVRCWPLLRPDRERGATMPEYILMATLIAVVVAVALVAFGPVVSAMFVSVAAVV